MKKILFIIYGYPYGSYDATTLCSVKVMSELTKVPDCEIHCVSYKQHKKGKQPYELNPDIILHPINLKERKQHSKFITHLQILLRMPIYPIFSICRILSHYKVCKTICKSEKFDLVISQYFPDDSVLVGAFLKKNGLVNKSMTVFWDNIYGKKPARVIPLWFARRRQKMLESFIAKNSTRIISLYPTKKFHDLYGDIPEAIGKRFYLGIPFIVPPVNPITTKYDELIKKNRINILYSGTIIKPKFIFDLLNMLNLSKHLSKINLLFFCQGLHEKTKTQLIQLFKGDIIISDYIPHNDLLSLYYNVDVFISFPGEIYSIRSKCYEYVSYGHPLIILYDNKEDVNRITFSNYPLCLTQDTNCRTEERSKDFDSFIDKNLGKKVPFHIVDNLFAKDNAKAYANIIKELL